MAGSYKMNMGSVRKGKDARASMAAVLANYNKFVRHVENVTPEILYAALEPTFQKSQEYCPTDTGAMKGSGYLEITAERGKPSVQIGYGFGGHPEYTATVHENLEYNHKAPTRAKWLQVALEEDEHQIQARIVSALRSVG